MWLKSAVGDLIQWTQDEVVVPVLHASSFLNEGETRGDAEEDAVDEETLNPFTLSTWQQQTQHDQLQRQPANLDHSNNETNSTEPRAALFPIQTHLNDMVVLMEGDILRLAVDAVVHFTDENFDSHSLNRTTKLIDKGGARLNQVMTITESCKCGDAVLTPSYSTPCRYLIHTVGPRYIEKYHTAAVNTLHACIRECLKRLVEHNLTTIAIPCTFTYDTNSIPLTLCAHVILRTLRGWLPRMKDNVKRVVLCSLDSAEISAYRELLPFYFPRTAEEEDLSCRLVPDDMGDDLGEALLPERNIPSLFLPHDDRLTSDEDPDECVDPLVDLSFARAEECDLTVSERRIVESETVRDLIESTDSQAEIGEVLYSRYMQDARQMKGSDLFREIAMFPFLYVGGKDRSGRNVIIFNASAFPGSISWYNLFLYIVWHLDPHIRDKFTLLFLAANISASNAPSLEFLREFHRVINCKYVDTLDLLLFLHPSATFRFIFTCSWPVMASRVWHAAVFVPTLQQLETYCNVSKLRLPSFVFDYDMDILSHVDTSG